MIYFLWCFLFLSNILGDFILIFIVLHNLFIRNSLHICDWLQILPPHWLIQYTPPKLRKLIYFYVSWESPLIFCLLNDSFIVCIFPHHLCVLELQQLLRLISVASWTTNCLQFPYCDMQLTAHTKWQPRADHVSFWPSGCHLAFYQFRFIPPHNRSTVQPFTQSTIINSFGEHSKCLRQIDCNLVVIYFAILFQFHLKFITLSD